MEFRTKREATQDRWTCRHCGAAGWWTPSTHLGAPPLFDHDRPDGKKCIRATK